MRIGDHVAVLELEGAEICPALIFDEKDVYLIDTGYPGQFPQFIKAMEAEGFPASRLTGIVLTHQDGDHIGGLNDAIAAAPDAVVMAHETEAPYIDGTKMSVKLKQMEENYDSLPAERQAWFDNAKLNWRKICAPVTRRLQGGETLPIAGGVEIIHTPGHTPGHICLYVRGDKLMLTGDALNADGGRLFGPHPEYSMDVGEAARSAQKLLHYDVEKLLCYHGGLVEKDIEESIQNLLK